MYLDELYHIFYISAKRIAFLFYINYFSFYLPSILHPITGLVLSDAKVGYRA